MFGILADHVYRPLAFDDLAFGATAFNRWFNFHDHYLLFYGETLGLYLYGRSNASASYLCLPPLGKIVLLSDLA
jgi:hypothetical protein